MRPSDVAADAKSVRDALVLHGGFALVCGFALALAPRAPGPLIAALVVIYSLAFLAVARLRGHEDWLRLAALTMPLSVLQVMPDWFLSQGLGILVFPDVGVPMIGTVPAFMAAMWTIPLNLSVLGGEAVRRRAGMPAGVLTAAVFALVLFAASEELVWRIPVWYAQHVHMIGHTAVYIVVPEVLLGITTFVGWQLTRSRPFSVKLATALAIMLIYAGSAAVSWLLIDA